jgi:hypothetical protein
MSSSRNDPAHWNKKWKRENKKWRIERNLGNRNQGKISIFLNPEQQYTYISGLLFVSNGASASQYLLIQDWQIWQIQTSTF